MKILVGTLSFAAGAVVCYLLFVSGVLQRVSNMPVVSQDAAQNVSIYLSFISVMLTAVTIVIAALAIGIGIVGAYTFSGLKTEARSTAQIVARDISEQTSKDVASEALSELKIKSIVETYLAVYVRDKAQEDEWGSEHGQGEER